MGSSNGANKQNSNGMWGKFVDNNIANGCYVVRNQMGHKCPMNEMVTKYLEKMMMNGNLFPVFIFTNSSDNEQSKQQQNAPNPFQNNIIQPPSDNQPFNFNFGG